MVSSTSPHSTTEDSTAPSSPSGASRGSRVARRSVLLGLTGAPAAFLAACSGGQGSAEGGSSPKGSAKTSPKPAGPPKVTVEPAAQTQQVNPVQPVIVRVSNGALSSVTVKDAAGKEVKGRIAEDKASFKTSSRLEFDSRYTVSYTLAGGQKGTAEFSTTTPPMQMDAYAYPGKGATVGIAQPVEITFSEPILNKKAVEKAIEIESTSGQKGRFYWLSDTKARYRPEKFWAPNSTVTIRFRLFGVDVGNGMIGNFDADHVFHVHNDRHAVVSNKDLMLRCYIDGKLVKTFPTTLGNPRWPSADGIFPIMEQQQRVWMNASTIGLKKGDQDYYDSNYYYWASRLTSTGIYVHQVAESLRWALGHDRVSHGCVSLPEEGAKWIFDNFDPGDYVEVRDTGNGTASMDKGFMDWNVPWSEYGT